MFVSPSAVPLPPGLSVSDRDIFDAVLVTLRPRQAAFVREYYAAGKVAQVAAERTAYRSGKNPKGIGWAGSLKVRRPGPIKTAVQAIDRLIARRVIPGLEAATADDLAELDAILATVRKRQVGFICQYFACGRDRDEAVRRSGYSSRNAGASGRQLMEKPAIRDAIKAIDDLLARRRAKGVH